MGCHRGPMRYVALFAPPLAVFACAALPTFSVATGVDASVADASTVVDAPIAADGSVSDAVRDVGTDAHTGNFHVFVTSSRDTPSVFGTPPGRSGADQFCKTAGKNVNSKSRWLAFLYTSSDTARSRLMSPSKGFYSVEKPGVEERLVFEDIQDINANPKVPINTELGMPVAADAGDSWARAWVGSTVFALQCDQWASSNDAHSGATGLATATDGLWEGRTIAASQACNVAARLYCFEQAP